LRWLKIETWPLGITLRFATSYVVNSKGMETRHGYAKPATNGRGEIPARREMGKGIVGVMSNVKTPLHCWLYIVTNCSSQPKLQDPIGDPGRFEWNEVAKVAHYYLSVDALTQPMRVCEDEAPYGREQK